MAMFPLGSVLLPGGVLPLHVFEPRYRQMVIECLQADGTPEFGQALITIVAPVTEHFAPAFVTVLERLIERVVARHIPAPTDLRVQHFIGPVEVLKQPR